MRRVVGLVALVLGALATALGLNVVRLPAPESPPPAPPPLEVNVESVAAKLAEAIRVPTVSTDAGGPPAEALTALHGHLERSFPRLFGDLPRVSLQGGTLVFEWRGRDETLAPLVLLAHQDVVPVPADGADSWTHPPFDGNLAGGYVWGRGALDDKASLVTLCETAEGLLERGFSPARTVYFAFGHDEEVGGSGARAVAGWLAERQARPALVLDEGLAITRGLAPGIERPVALLGIAEKGYASFELRTRGAEGHSSMPPRETAIGVLAAALARITAEPLEACADSPAFAMFDALAPAAPFGMRVVLANRWLLGGLLERQLSGTASGDAMLRSTLAPTLLESGTKENVLPRTARAVVNLRILPGDTPASLEAELRRRIGDERVELALIGEASAASPVSDPTGWGYRTVAQSVREIERQAIVAPGLMIGATDSRHFTALAHEVIRFQPVLLEPGDLPRFHGVDERISIDNLERAVRIYTRILENAAG